MLVRWIEKKDKQLFPLNEHKLKDRELSLVESAWR